jgi:hypothetical protein
MAVDEPGELTAVPHAPLPTTTLVMESGPQQQLLWIF